MRWQDTRVKFIQLEKGKDTILSQKDPNKLWLPYLIFETTPQISRTIRYFLLYLPMWIFDAKHRIGQPWANSWLKHFCAKKYFFLARDDVLAIHAYGVNPRNQEDLSQLYDYNLFQGLDAQIKARRKYNEIFTCEFQLKMYPFDSQICEMSFQLVQHQQSSVFLSTECPWEIPLNGDTTVGEFRISKIEGKNLLVCLNTCMCMFVCNCVR